MLSSDWYWGNRPLRGLGRTRTVAAILMTELGKAPTGPSSRLAAKKGAIEARYVGS